MLRYSKSADHFSADGRRWIVTELLCITDPLGGTTCRYNDVALLSAACSGMRASIS